MRPPQQKFNSGVSCSEVILAGTNFGPYILVFYCPSARLAIELDGDSHFTDQAIEHDRQRTAYLNALHIKVLRFLNTEVYENLSVAGERILEEIEKKHPDHPQPPP